MLRRSVVAVLCLALVTPMGAAAGAEGTSSYIVVLKAGRGDPGAVSSEHSKAHGIKTKHVYRHALRGYAARMSSTAATRIARDQRVAYVEPDGAVQASATQSGATWGLDRIDQRALSLDGSYTYNATGVGVTAYIIDTGIRYSHTEFGGRATFGFDSFGGSGSDCNGHGTHVAGTVGGTVYGVAKTVSLKAVRVLDCNGSGSWSGVIAGVDWVTGHHTGIAPAVANMSLGGSYNSSVNDAVQASIADGVTYSVAAGNGNMAGRAQDACNYSPASAPDALTIGATTSSDSKTSWSNYGTCLDLFAPGASITSAWSTGDTATNTISGTSMAAPHVAGVAALYLEGSPAAQPPAVEQAIESTATAGIVTNAGPGSPNLLLYSLLTTDGSGGGDGGDGGGGDLAAPSNLTAEYAGKKGVNFVINLRWTANTGVDVYRNGSRIATNVTGSSYEDKTKTGGTIKYKVCNTGTEACSAEVSVTV